ncbi:AI-2E family transporter [Enterococcus gallinarum]|uniref:AI-2E family transporter n=1 Tax=Enterococcus gallinarum TaxID=1353 RepID=UPI0012E21367|nr:AI-2E family transporter [Enterococcus gallinarum]MUO32727.1 AI-2E family transporter [Enterococcus gallinarum]
MKKNRLIQFLGGKTSYYVLGLIILCAIAAFLLKQISFLFDPFFVIISTLIPPFLFGLILYYLFNPLVDRLETKKIPRIASIGGIYLLILLVIVLAGFQLYPIIQKQTTDLINQFPDLIADFERNADSFLANTPFGAQIDQITDTLQKVANNIMDFIGDYWQTGAAGLSSIFSTISTLFIALFTGPIIAFFLLRNPNKFYYSLLSIVPPRFRKDFNTIVKIADLQVGAFLKGQIISSFILGGIYWVIFLLIGLEYASILAIAAGILCIIPYIGPFIVFFPALFIAAQDSTGMLIKFLIAWFAVQLLHGDLVVPRVMGDRLQIHPITILVVLLVMGDLMGIVGVIFGIPIYCLLKVLVVYGFRKFKQRYNTYYGDEGKYFHSEFTSEDYLKDEQ